MTALEWGTRPELNQPIIVAAFEGWNDAGDAASRAVRYLIERWGAQRFASIDPEEFYDFTSLRPTVRIVSEECRELDWPENVFWHASPEGSPDIILLLGTEPHLKWRTFCAAVIEVAQQTHSRLVLTLGALLADVPHSRPTSVFGTAYDPTVIDALNLESSRYEGPTGIVGVLHHECAQAGIHSASFWSAVPSYVASVPSPKAQHALVHRICELLGTKLDLADLGDAVNAYDEEIGDLVAEDQDTIIYVRHLEEAHDRDEAANGSVDDLVAELERFLREQ